MKASCTKFINLAVVSLLMILSVGLGNRVYAVQEGDRCYVENECACSDDGTQELRCLSFGGFGMNLFAAACLDRDPCNFLEVTTAAVTTYAIKTAMLGGEITDITGKNATKRGVCWNTTGNPTVADMKKEESGSFGAGSFTFDITALSPVTTYYVRAYATNSEEITYGEEISFSTLGHITLHLVTGDAGYNNDGTVMLEIDETLEFIVEMDNSTNGSIPIDSVEFSVSYNSDVVSLTDFYTMDRTAHLTPSVETKGSGTDARANVQLAGNISEGTGGIISLQFTAVGPGNSTFILVADDIKITSETIPPPVGEDYIPAIVEGEPQVLTVPEPIILGDLNGDQIVDIKDNILALKVLAGTDVPSIHTLYAVAYGKINIGIASYILQVSLARRRKSAVFDKRNFNIPKKYRASSARMAVGSAEGVIGEHVELEVTVDSGDIAGAAFTVEYDSDIFELVTVESDFFGTFASQGFEVSSVEGYDRPLIFNVIEGKAMIAAARATEGTAGVETVLFTLKFMIKEGAVKGTDYAINIVPTVLSNPDAGYDPQGEEIDLLLGVYNAYESTYVYPVLLAAVDVSSCITGGIVSIVEPEPMIAATSMGDNGGISPSGTITVAEGGSQTFTMIPNAGYEVEDVVVDGMSVGPVTIYTFKNVNDAHTIHAIFRPISMAQKKAIIVAGSRSYPNDYLWDNTELCTNYAYLALLEQEYTRENILYLSPNSSIDVDSDGYFNDVDNDATKANLSDAITNWAKDAGEVLLYMTDHGGNGTFHLNENEIIRAQGTEEEPGLDNWLDELQETMAGRVIFIYDACQSGSFIPLLTPPPGKERILITSSSPHDPAYFLNSGALSFSYQFWAHVFYDANLYHSFDIASVMMKAKQNAHLDANGDGIGYDESEMDVPREDKLVIKDMVIGKGIETASAPPVINSISADQPILDGETSVTIRADNITALNEITRVWAVIIPPDYTHGSPDTPVTDLPTAELTDTDSDGTYEGVYDGFGKGGVYKITVYATDTLDTYSLPAQTTVVQTKRPFGPKGDLSGNGETELEDAIIALKILSEMTWLIWYDYAASGADVNGDDRIGLAEVVYILKKILQQSM